jgi:hypothetical protein
MKNFLKLLNVWGTFLIIYPYRLGLCKKLSDEEYIMLGPLVRYCSRDSLLRFGLI